jgi:hypothetical protein
VSTTAPFAPERPEDTGPRAVALGVTSALHACVVLVLALSARPAVVVEPETPPFEWMDVEQIPALGKMPEPNALPRIVQAPAPPEPEAAPVNLNQEREEEPETPVEKVPEEKKEQDDLDKKRLEDEKKLRDDERKKRAEAMARAMNNLDDPRADEDSPDGNPDGSAFGTSTGAATMTAQNLWMAEVTHALKQRFEAPAALSPGERRKLQASIHFVLDTNGRVKGKARLVESSGNAFYDDAAVRALAFFGEDGNETLPMPNSPLLSTVKKTVMQQGMTMKMRLGQ